MKEEEQNEANWEDYNSEEEEEKELEFEMKEKEQEIFDAKKKF